MSEEMVNYWVIHEGCPDIWGSWVYIFGQPSSLYEQNYTSVWTGKGGRLKDSGSQITERKSRNRENFKEI